MSDLFVVTTVCTGNTCRSPLAQVLLQKHLSDRGFDSVDVHSAGMAAPTGQRATTLMVNVAESFGVELSEHRSQPLTLPLVNASQLLLCATAVHRAAIFAQWPHLAQDRVALYQDLVPGAKGHDVSDPYGLGQGDYDLSGALIDRAMDAWANHLVERLAS